MPTPDDELNEPTNADTPEDDTLTNDAPPLQLQIVTPFGTFTDLADVPPSIRQFLTEHLDHIDLPAEVRAHLSRTLEQESARLPGDDESPTGEIKKYREQVWDILDAVFPKDPHLWQAAEALFMASSTAPTAELPGFADSALQHAHAHLHRHSPTADSAGGHTEQLVKRFREQLGDL